MRNIIGITTVCSLMAFGVSTSPATAGSCYDTYGCTNRNFFKASDLISRGPNCEFLWTMRNSIYHEKGYCFRTARGMSTFGNAGCRYDDVNGVPLNRYERANVAVIAQAERQKGCPR